MIIIAHRGGAAEVLENSYSAFYHAVKVGADSMEADLRATKDGKIVIMHDATLSRTASAQGKIADFTFKELKKIKLKNGEPILDLQKLLDLAKGKISLHLEIKEPGFERTLVQILKKKHMEKSVTIISFYPEILKKIHKLNSKLKTGFIFAKPRGESACPAFCEIILPQERLLTLKSVKRFHEMRKEIHAWVINDPKRAKELLAWGIDEIATDRPKTLLHLFGG